MSKHKAVVKQKQPDSAAQPAQQKEAGPAAKNEAAAVQDAAGNQAATQLLGSAGGVPAPVVIAGAQAIRATIYFAHNSAALRGANREAVQQLSRRLSGLQQPDVTVNGHASTEGPAPHNQALSAQRRQAVTSVLGKGLPGKPAFAGEGLGETRPAVPETGEGQAQIEQRRALNRRVEIVIHLPAGAAGAKAGQAEPWTISPDPRPSELPGPRRDKLPGPRRAPEAALKPLPPSVRKAAEEAGAPPGVTFEGLAQWLEEESPSKNIARFASKLAPLVGQDPKEVEKSLRDAARSGIEEGLKAALKALVELAAGALGKAAPPLPGPAGATEIPFPSAPKVPIPFPGDKPAAPRARAGLTIVDKAGPNMTKLNYRSGEFITVSVTTAGWLPQGLAKVEITDGSGSKTFANDVVAGGRSNVSVSLAVPDTAGRYQIRLRFGDDVRDSKWFSVRKR